MRLVRKLATGDSLAITAKSVFAFPVAGEIAFSRCNHALGRQQYQPWILAAQAGLRRPLQNEYSFWATNKCNTPKGEGIGSMSLITTLVNTLTATGLLMLLALGTVQAQSAEATPTSAEKAAIAEEATAPGSVTQAVFTTAVVDGEPADYLTEIENTVPEVVFFTVLEGMSGQTVSHRWKYNDTVMATAKLEVKRDVDQVWSSNKMKPEWTGEWVVEVVDGSGQIIGRGSFVFQAPL